jgi:hypothetical protein
MLPSIVCVCRERGWGERELEREGGKERESDTSLFIVE